MNVLEKNLPAEEDHVAGEQDAAASVLEQQRDMAVRVAGRIQDRQSQCADLDGCPFFEFVVDREWLQVVIERIDSRLLGNIEAHRLLVPIAQAVGDDSRRIDRRLAEQLAEARRAPGMVAMAVGENHVPDPRGVESVLLHIGDDRLGPHARADVDQGQLVASIHKVDMAVEGIGEVEATAA